MAGEWPATRLRDHAELLVGFAFKSEGFREKPPGTRLARGDNITEGHLRWDGKTRFWPNLTDDLRRYLLRPGDVVVGMDGSKVGRNWAQVRLNDLPLLLVQRVACLRARDTLDQGFLAALIGSELFKDHVKAIRTGSSIPHVSGGQIGEFAFRLPPIREQRRIAQILGSLDDKIELNRRMGETQEAIARALFKSWFVDFDPVRAKSEGRDTGLPEHFADLFPASFDDSELGVIPSGWRIARLPEVLKVNPPRRLGKGVVAPHLEMAKMPTRGHSPDEVLDRPFGSGTRFLNGDTLVAKITPCLENGKTAYVDFLKPDEVGWGSTEYIVLRAEPPLPTEYAYCLARSPGFREFAIQSMTGSSGRQRVPVESLSHFLIVSPPAEVGQLFGRVVRPLFAQTSTAVAQSRTLVALRDSLLPRLVSGQIPVLDRDRLAATLDTPPAVQERLALRQGPVQT